MRLWGCSVLPLRLILYLPVRDLHFFFVAFFFFYSIFLYVNQKYLEKIFDATCNLQSGKIATYSIRFVLFLAFGSICESERGKKISDFVAVIIFHKKYNIYLKNLLVHPWDLFMYLHSSSVLYWIYFHWTFFFHYYTAIAMLATCLSTWRRFHQWLKDVPVVIYSMS